MVGLNMKRLKFIDFFINKYLNKYERFFAGILPAEEIEYGLEIRK